MDTAKTLVCVILVTIFSEYCNANEVNCSGLPNCISIKKCKPFITFLETVEKPLKPSVVNFLKAHECGFDEGYPKVCCAELPKNLKILKTTPTILSTTTVGTITTIASTTSTTTTMKVTKKPSTFGDKDRRIEEFNAAFYDLLDFDLFRRRRKITDGLEVEIR